jgi:[ribosomal protein S5]-alanine N-acetyltransferase
MDRMTIRTPRLKLVVASLDEARARVATAPSEVKEQMSADWLGLLESATFDDPWIVGFAIHQRVENAAIGQCGFKGPPSDDGVVEIAYTIEAEHRGKGYATEAARALRDFALREPNVELVRAHTLPTSNASTRVLTKCGFVMVGEVVDLDDGPVWRWEART